MSFVQRVILAAVLTGAIGEAIIKAIGKLHSPMRLMHKSKIPLAIWN